MNKLTKRATFIIAIAAMLSGACKKEANYAGQADSVNPAVSTTGIEANATYRPEILGSIKEPKGVYNPFDFGVAPPFDYNKILSVPMADVGSITVTVNQKTFVYRLNNGDEVLATTKPSGYFDTEVTFIGVDKAQNSQITIRFSSYGYYYLREISFKFDGLDAPGAVPSVVEYSSLYSPLSCIHHLLKVEMIKGKVKAKGVFYGGMIYRAGTWTSKSDMVVSGSFNIEPPKI